MSKSIIVLNALRIQSIDGNKITGVVMFTDTTKWRKFNYNLKTNEYKEARMVGNDWLKPHPLHRQSFLDFVNVNRLREIVLGTDKNRHYPFTRNVKQPSLL